MRNWKRGVAPFLCVCLIGTNLAGTAWGNLDRFSVPEKQTAETATVSNAASNSDALENDTKVVSDVDEDEIFDDRVAATWHNAREIRETSQYKVTFDYDGVWAGKAEEVCYVTEGNFLNTPFGPTPSSDTGGKAIVGWRRENGEILKILSAQYWVTDSGNTSGSGSTVSFLPEGDETLTAIWDDCHEVTLELNGGNFVSGSYQEKRMLVPDGIAMGSLPAVQKEGATLTGWIRMDTGFLINERSVITGDVKISAQWGEYYVVQFDANGGICTSPVWEKKEIVKGQGISLPSHPGNFEKNGYLLVGWSEEPSGTEPLLTGYYAPQKDVTLYAVWKNCYLLTFDAGEGFFYSNKNTKTREVKVEPGKPIGNLTDPQSDLSVFIGWYTVDGKQVLPTYYPTTDETLYAKWSKENMHTVTLHGIEGYNSYAEVPTTLKVAHGESLGDIGVYRNGYLLKWYRDPELKIPFNQYSGVIEDMDLYAGWERSITVSWDANGGRDSLGNGMGSQLVENHGRVLLPAVSRDGYSFEGWFTADGMEISGDTIVHEPLEVRAKWGQGYLVTIDMQGGDFSRFPTWSMEKTDSGYQFRVKKGMAVGATLGNYIINAVKHKEGAFDGWYDEEGNRIDLSRFVPYQNINITAKWAPDFVKVRFHGGGSYFYHSGNETDIMELLVKKGAGLKEFGNELLVEQPENIGNMVFAGWSQTEDGSQLVDLDTCQFLKDTDLYPIWKERWTVSFNYMGGSTSSSYNGFSKSDYQTVQIPRGEEVTYPSNDSIYKPGYLFDGWYENVNGTGEKISVPFTPDRDMNLYAKWIPDQGVKWTVTFDTRGGSSVSSQQIENGKRLVMPTDPQKADSQFIGWYLDESLKKGYSFSNRVLKDITLYAGWKGGSGENNSGNGSDSEGGNNSGGGNDSEGGNNSGGGNDSEGGNNSGGGNGSGGGNNSGGGNDSEGGNNSGGGNSSGGGSSSSGGSSGGGTSSGNQKSSLPPGYQGTTKTIHGVTVPSYVIEGVWTQTEDGRWKLAGTDGTNYINQWAPVYNPYADLSQGQEAFDWFWFDENGIMVTGWFTDAEGNQYYLNPDSDHTKGKMVTGWRLIDGMYYYFNQNADGARGTLLKNTYTPDGVYVGSDGARVN